MATKKKMLQAAAGQAGGAALDITDVFSTYLYEGNGDGSAAQNVQTITNGIDLSGEGGMVWIKGRSHTTDHIINDTVRGAGNALQPNLTDANQTGYYDISQFNSNGFGLDAGGNVNNNGYDYASWTFRKAPKFFDVVTYTGDGSTQTLNHSLDSVPGVIIVKRTDATSNWSVYHNTLLENYYLRLNSTDSTSGFTGGFWGNGPTSTQFSVGNSDVNASGGTYVAYLFAHNNNDGEFGPDGDQDIIKCGSMTYTSGTPLAVDLGFEPQWVLVKRTDGADNWFLTDVMRGASVDEGTWLQPSTSNAEGSSSGLGIAAPTATGFIFDQGSTALFASGTYIYMAIRRGTKVPESATDVFDVNTYANNSNSNIYDTGFNADMNINTDASATEANYIIDRLRGGSYLKTNDTGPDTPTAMTFWDDGNNILDLATSWWGTTSGVVSWSWKRAPSFCDVVAYTGLGTAGSHNHNLLATPEMAWFKARNSSQEWIVYHKDLTAGSHLRLNTTHAELTGELTTSFAVSDTQFTFANDFATTNSSSTNYIAYLFATLPGVSKVGSYTGTGNTAQTIDCGFSSGARFVLIKRSSGASHWYVFDTERGITSTVNDGVLMLNLTNAEQPESSAFGASIDAIQPDSSGFKVQYSDINESGATFIFYAIA